MRRLISCLLILLFLLSSLSGKSYGFDLVLPQPGTRIALSQPYHPALIKGITVYPKEPFRFSFIVDPGQDALDQKESQKLIKYFMAALTIPDEKLWVNLSPFEKDRIIADELSVTQMGRELLGEDYILKQLMSSLSDPNSNLGKNFWDRVYQKTYQMYGANQLPINTFNKVWIVPDQAEIFERNQTAIVASSHLKVMMEEDYISLKNHNGIDKAPKTDGIRKISSDVAKEILLPEIEKEVNEGKNFAGLRQVYNSLILAVWYKKQLKESLLSRSYVNQSNVHGIGSIKNDIRHSIFAKYIQAYKRGVYNFIKEDSSKRPRKYFSGGVDARHTSFNNRSQFSALSNEGKSEISTLTNTVSSLRVVEARFDRAMNGTPILETDIEVEQFFRFLNFLEQKIDFPKLIKVYRIILAGNASTKILRLRYLDSTKVNDAAVMKDIHKKGILDKSKLAQFLEFAFNDKRNLERLVPIKIRTEYSKSIRLIKTYLNNPPSIDSVDLLREFMNGIRKNSKEEYDSLLLYMLMVAYQNPEYFNEEYLNLAKEKYFESEGFLALFLQNKQYGFNIIESGEWDPEDNKMLLIISKEIARFMYMRWAYHMQEKYGKIVDKAIFTSEDEVQKQIEPGGIDLNTQQLNLKIYGQESMVRSSIEEDNITPLNLIPVIKEIRSAVQADLPVLN